MKKITALLLLLFATGAFGVPFTFTWDDKNPGASTVFNLTANGVVNSGIIGTSKVIDVPIIPGGLLDAKINTAVSSTYYDCSKVTCPPPSTYATFAAILPADPINLWATRVRTGGSTMTKPTFVGSQSTTFNNTATSKTTTALAVTNGDFLVAVAATADSPATLAITSSPSLTWTLKQSDTTSGHCSTYLWTATANATGNQTITLTRSGSDVIYGGMLSAWNASAGFGNSAKSQGSGAPTLNLTTTQANSAIMLIDSDWAAVTGTVTPRTNAGAFTQVDNYADGSAYGVHTGYHADAGATNTYAVGYTAPTGQTYNLMAVEIKGVSGGTVFNQSASGTLAFSSGTVKKTDSKLLAGLLAFSLGGLVRSIAKKTSGTLSFTGVFTAMRLFVLALSGALSFVGNQTRMTAKGLSGVLSFVGLVTKITAKKLITASLSFVGSLAGIRSILKAVSGALSFTGITLKSTNKALAASLSFTGTEIKASAKSIAGGLSFTGTTIKTTAKKLVTATLSFIGSLATATGAHIVFQAVGGILAFTGGIVKQIATTRSGTLPLSGLTTKSTSKKASGTLSFTGAFIGMRAFVKAVSGTLSFASGTIKRSVLKNIAASLNLTGSSIKAIRHILPGSSLAFSGATNKMIAKPIAAMLSFSGTIATSLNQLMIGYIWRPSIALIQQVKKIFLSSPTDE
jgi:hypothetical protein